MFCNKPRMFEVNTAGFIAWSIRLCVREPKAGVTHNENWWKRDMQNTKKTCSGGLFLLCLFYKWNMSDRDIHLHVCWTTLQNKLSDKGRAFWQERLTNSVVQWSPFKSLRLQIQHFVRSKLPGNRYVQGISLYEDVSNKKLMKVDLISFFSEAVEAQTSAACPAEKDLETKQSIKHY